MITVIIIIIIQFITAGPQILMCSYNWYNNLQCSVKWNDVIIDPLSVKCGARQRVFSSSLFVMYVDKLIIHCVIVCFMLWSINGCNQCGVKSDILFHHSCNYLQLSVIKLQISANNCYSGLNVKTACHR